VRVIGFSRGWRRTSRTWRRLGGLAAEVKDDLAWLQFVALEAQQVWVGDLLQAYNSSTLQTLTGYAYFVEAINALESSQNHITVLL